MTTLPNVQVFLRVKDPIWQWVLPVCPRCGKEHAHYAGMLDDDPRNHLDGRSYVCRHVELDDVPDYNLVDADPEGTARTVAEIRRRAA